MDQSELSRPGIVCKDHGICPSTLASAMDVGHVKPYPTKCGSRLVLESDVLEWMDDASKRTRGPKPKPKKRKK